MRTFQKVDLRELSLCLIRTLDAMGPPIKVQKKQKLLFDGSPKKCIICSLILI